MLGLCEQVIQRFKLAGRLQRRKCEARHPFWQVRDNAKPMVERLNL